MKRKFDTAAATAEIKRRVAAGETISAIARDLGMARPWVGKLAKRPDDWRPKALGPVPYPVCIRGVTYPSCEAAGKALGVRASTVRNLIAEGRADQIGLGRGKASPPNHRKPLRIGPFEFESMAEAARKLDAGHECTVRKMVRRGRMEPLLAAAMKLEARA